MMLDNLTNKFDFIEIREVDSSFSLSNIPKSWLNSEPYPDPDTGEAGEFSGLTVARILQKMKEIEMERKLQEEADRRQVKLQFD